MPSSPQKRTIPAKQLQGVESPATVLLHPVIFDREKGLGWWTHDGVLCGGIQVTSAPGFAAGDEGRIAYLPTPIPRSWGQRAFDVVVEYEAESSEARFQLRCYYGCGDPSELHLGETALLKGKGGGKQRLRFRLNEAHLTRNELFRCAIGVIRQTPEPVLVYGVWLEVGVEYLAEVVSGRGRDG
jgi:hypothetical protein